MAQLRKKSKPNVGRNASYEDEDSDVFTTELPQVTPVGNRCSRIDSFSSVTSVYSADGGKGDYAVSGKVMVGIWHKHDTLYVRIVKASGLAAAKTGGISDPYVKTYLLPDKSKYSKRKTGIQRKTTNPEYNEIVKNRLPHCDIKLHTLWLSVWDWDKFGRNKFLGEVRLPLSSLDLTNPTDHWYPLKEKKKQAGRMDVGQLKLSLIFNPPKGSNCHQQKGSLCVSIKEAKDLPQMDPKGLTDATVRMYLLPKRSLHTKKKTKIIENTCNPTWNENFEFKYLTLDELQTKRVLEVTVWDYDRRGCNDFIGCLRIGPDPSDVGEKEWMDSRKEEVEHWEKMLAHPGEEVECWHRLRPSIVVQSASSETEPLSDGYSQEGGLDDLPPSSTPRVHDTDEEDSSSAEESLYGSKTSLYDESCVKGDYDITGEIYVGVEYRNDNLKVKIPCARGLAAADSNGLSDPYIQCVLLPDRSKHSKRKTTVKMETLNPNFNETLIYKDLKESELPSRTLWLTVWDWDRLGKNEFLGEVKLPLVEVNLEDSGHKWYPLKDTNEDMSSTLDPNSRGELQLGLKFEPIKLKKNMKGTLHIDVQRAKSLPNMDVRGFTDGFVKLNLRTAKCSKNCKKTKVIKNNLNPVWNETFTYEKVTLDSLSTEQVLEVTVWDHDFPSSNDFIGALRIGPAPNKMKKRMKWMDSSKDEASHWEEMLELDNFGKWVVRWHSLRPSTDYRDPDSAAKILKSLSKDKSIDCSVSKESVKDEEKDCNQGFNLHRGSRVIHGHHTSRPILKKRNISARTEADSSFEQCPPVTEQGSSLLHKQSKIEEENSTSPEITPELSPDLSGRPKAESTETESDAVIVNASTPLAKGDSVSSGLASGDSFDCDQGLERSLSCSMASIHHIKGEYYITGAVLFGVYSKGGQLIVHIEKARKLTILDSSELPDPYVAVNIFSSKGKKVFRKKTDIKEKTCDPIFEQKIKFKVSQKDLVSASTLILKVWSWSKTRRQFLGEIKLPFSSLDLNDTYTHWHALQDNVKGEIHLAMKFHPSGQNKKGKIKGSMQVIVKELRNWGSSNPATDSVIKYSCYFLPEKGKKEKKGGEINEDYACFEKLDLSELSSEKVLEVTVWNSSRGSCSDFIGRLHLGPAPTVGAKHKEWMDSVGDEVRHWESVMAHQGEWVEMWHSLRSMDSI